MIRKLRRKFVLINMLFVCAVLLAVFGAILLTSYQKQEQESIRSMGKALEWSGEEPPPMLGLGPGPGRPPREDFAATPVFVVLLEGDGSVASISAGNVEVSDGLAAQAAAAAAADGGKSGYLSGLRLRFLKRDTPDGIKIAFADASGEWDSLSGLLLTSLLVGAGGFAAFFAVSVFLANWALRPVEQAWKQQRQFVADASHELKTPLTVILANTGILLSHPQDTVANQRKWVEHTRTEAERMKKLVDDLLYLAKSDAGRHTERVWFNLSDTVWSGLLPFESVAFEQGVELESDVAPDIFLAGDEARIRQLVAILLDNACKYAGEKGKVRLKLERLPEGKAARLRVSNTGEPIQAEHLEHLFERFYRADSARAREQGGYGLGLAIARTIAEEHQGRIEVESSREQGTSFTVTLSLRSGSPRGARNGK